MKTEIYSPDDQLAVSGRPSFSSFSLYHFSLQYWIKKNTFQFYIFISPNPPRTLPTVQL